MENFLNIFKNLLNKLTHNSNYYMILEIFILTIIILFLYKWRYFNIQKNYPAVVNMLMLIILLLMLVSYFFVKERGNDNLPKLSSIFLKTFGIVGTIGLFFLVLYLIQYVITKYSIFSNLLSNILGIGLILITGSLVYLISKKYLDKIQKKNSLISLLIKIVFYIPCLIVYLTEYLKEQYKITTKTVWIILGFELLLIGLMMLIPLLNRYYMKTQKGKLLLNKPIYLNNERNLGDISDLGNVPSYNYSISLWFYINPQPPNTNKSYTEYTNLFSYGGSPNLEYNGLKNELRISNNDIDKKIVVYSTNNIYYQKWNNLVINYNGGNMDIFINGELVGTKQNIVRKIDDRHIICGKDNGIHGGICNVKKFNKVLSKSHIIANYKLLRDKNEPIL